MVGVVAVLENGAGERHLCERAASNAAFRGANEAPGGNVEVDEEPADVLVLQELGNDQSCLKPSCVARKLSLIHI